MIDLHCHILPGLDDGPDTLEDTVALARAAKAAGVSTVVATPHVSWRYSNDTAAISRAVGAVNRRLAVEKVGLSVVQGAEIAMTRLFDLAPQEISGLGLGGGPWLLVEPPLTAVADGMDSLLIDVQRSGHRIVLAHAERCLVFHRSPAVLQELVRSGALVSITAGSLVGRFGNRARTFAKRLVGEGLVHNVASDAHDHIRRPPGMSDELRRAGLEPLAEWLTLEVPRAILAGDQTIPPRPSGYAGGGLSPPRPSSWRRAVPLWLRKFN